MAYPVLEFAGLSFDENNDFYSNETQVNSFIRIQADYVSGSPNVTNIAAVSGFFGINEIRPGMVIVSSGEISGESTVVSVDVGNNSLVMADNAIASATGQTTRIRPQKGLYFIVSASLAKLGNGEPANWRSVTGSNDSEYNANFNKWGVVAALAETGSVTTSIKGLYGQYQLTEITSRITTLESNIFLSSSNDLGPNFTEDSGSIISQGDNKMILAEISNENGLMPIMGAGDVGSGFSQGLSLGAYNASVEAIFAQLTSGSGFPFTGSAQITGSIGLTGSQANLIQTSENFIIKSATAPTQSYFEMKGDGVAVFRAREGVDGTPSAVVGGLYFTTSSAFIGVD